ncbi:MAG: TraB/GumN family protein, partial [Thermodesulfobacteriota bacterium]
MRKVQKLLSAFFAVIFASSLLFIPDALCQPQKSFLWRVRSETNTVYVLGSLHFSKQEIYPLRQEIENAFDQSDFLVVEANVNDIGKTDVQKLIEGALYPANDRLEKHVSAETFERVKKEMGELGLPPELINRQKPWFLAMTIVALESAKLGLDPKLGIDMYFLSKAQGKKKILELESLDYQI